MWRVVAIAPVLAWGCGSDSDTPAAPSDPQAGIGEVQVRALEPAGQVDAAARAECQALLAKAWAATATARELLAVRDPAAERAYLNSEAFLARCAGLAGEQRACLAGADNPMLAISGCGVNAGRPADARLFAPSLRTHVGVLVPDPLEESTAAALLDDLVGSWRNDGAAEAETWTVSTSGALTIERDRGGRTDARALVISLEEEQRMTLRSERGSQVFVLAMPSRRWFYAGGNLAHDAFAIEDDEQFVVRDGGDYIFYREGTCTVVDVTGAMAGGECEMAREGRERLFRARYAVPGRVGADGEPGWHEAIFLRDRGFLVHAELARCCRFDRR